MSIFTGSACAIITPFKENGHDIDFDLFEKLIDFQLSNGTDALVVAGTTGEASTLTDEDQIELIRFAVKAVNHRIPVIAGAGSNDTAHGIRLSVNAANCGADALLQVTPYYNKTSQKGLIEHFTAIADAVSIPIILYDVPGRTSMTIQATTCARLAEHPNIVALKDATGNLGHTAEVRRLCGDSLDLYSGNDDVIMPLMALGGKGVISVLANICPRETHELCALMLEGRVAEAAALQIKYKTLIDALFVEPNPIPVKAAMKLMGYDVDRYRLPLTTAGDSTIALLRKEMTALNLL